MLRRKVDRWNAVCDESRMHGVEWGKALRHRQGATYHYPNMLDATTLSDKMEKQIAGIIRMGDGYVFTANYTPTAFNLVQGLEGHQYDYALWLGGSSTGDPTGSRGKFSWTGDIRAGFPGKGVDDVAEMSITCTPSTDTQWSAS